MCSPRFVTTAASSSSGVGSQIANNIHHHEPSLDVYVPIPQEYVLQQLVVIHRHGDRSQIQRSLGPSVAESKEVEAVWVSRMPVASTLLKMAQAARVVSSSSNSDNIGNSDNMYTGEDAKNYPYAQLTELGAQQLMLVGKSLRERYASFLEGGVHDESIMARSTNMCRTLQSLRCLLIGLTSSQDAQKALADQSVVVIKTRPKSSETLFPQASGPCDRMAERRNEIFPPTFLAENVDGYAELEERMKNLLGYTEKVNWLTVKEILTCHLVHDIPFHRGITELDEEKISAIAGRTWGQLYRDEVLNRLAIGRFIRELLDDIVGTALTNKKMLIYSGHDSTLVPVLCALGAYNDKWPPYASHLELEIVQHKRTGERFVRAVYNDHAQTILGHTSSHWTPLDMVMARLEKLALTNEEYALECSAGGGEAFAEAKRAMEQEIKATTSSN